MRWAHYWRTSQLQVIAYEKSLDHLFDEVGKYIAAGARQIILELSPGSSPDAVQTIVHKVAVTYSTPQQYSEAVELCAL
jgi:hypothetical protein